MRTAERNIWQLEIQSLEGSILGVIIQWVVPEFRVTPDVPDVRSDVGDWSFWVSLVLKVINYKVDAEGVTVGGESQFGLRRGVGVVCRRYATVMDGEMSGVALGRFITLEQESTNCIIANQNTYVTTNVLININGSDREVRWEIASMVDPHSGFRYPSWSCIFTVRMHRGIYIEPPLVHHPTISTRLVISFSCTRVQ